MRNAVLRAYRRQGAGAVRDSFRGRHALERIHGTACGDGATVMGTAKRETIHAKLYAAQRHKQE